jgi:hypothetical protein
MQYTDDQLIHRVESNAKGFTSWADVTDGMVDIWVRTAPDTSNVFKDKVYTYAIVNGAPVFAKVCTGTSKAGTTGLLKPTNPLGCAILKSDQIVYNSHMFGKHKGEYFAYVQAKPFPFYRDNNKNLEPEEIGQLYNGPAIGANCHHAGVNSTYIFNWSEGCLVRNVLVDFYRWMQIMNKRKFLTVCILKEF